MDLKKYIRDVENFPIEWIIFKDISPILENPEAFWYAVEELSKNCENIDKIVWLDARGFIFWAALAYKLKKPFVMVRKTWKLPYKTISQSYELEYGKASFDIHIDSILPWDKVVIIDDLLATGWTAKASIQLIEKLGWIVKSLNFIINLKFLNWEKNLEWYKINSLIEY